MKILLGVSGGIAAYKSCELLRQFQAAGHQVTVIMTHSAKEFVTPLSFEALSGQGVYDDLFQGNDRGIAHIELARAHDVFVIAPATAATLSQMAQGQASNLLLTAYLAFEGPVFVAPAMNTKMWDHPSTQRNILQLEKDGVQVLAPIHGELACGEIGSGKMMEPQDICTQVLGAGAASSTRFENKKIVVTAGATREYLDPVRFVSSPSTGRMGVAIANAFAREGADVLLIHGHMDSSLSIHPKVTRQAVESAVQLMEGVQSKPDFDVFVASAAVGDYRAATPATQKMKKGQEHLSLELTKNPDLLAWVGEQKKNHQIVVGFAAETQDLIENARLKLSQKNLDLIVANEVHKEDKGFGAGKTDVVFLSENEERQFKNISKSELAKELCDEVFNLIKRKIR